MIPRQGSAFWEGLGTSLGFEKQNLLLVWDALPNLLKPFH